MGRLGQGACCSCLPTHEPGSLALATLQGCLLPSAVWDRHLCCPRITLSSKEREKRKGMVWVMAEGPLTWVCGGKTFFLWVIARDVE